MSETFSCPTCGAPLEYKHGMDLTFPCPYCGNSVIVPENLRPQTSEPKEYQPDTSNYVNESAILQKIQELLKAGKKSEAIQLYRYCYSDGLTSAKKVVDEIEAGTVTELPENKVDPSILGIYSSEPKKSSRKGCVSLFLLVAILLAVILMAVLVSLLIAKPDWANLSPTPTTTSTSRPGPTRVPLATQIPRPTANEGGRIYLYEWSTL
jgi:uncharacterized Zn finger protein (UPF0148 family)